MHPIDLAITGVSSFVADPITIDEWADIYKVPDRQTEGKFLDGKMVEKILGIQSKSWAPDVFKDPQLVINTAKTAMQKANVAPEEIEAAIIITCSPFMVQLDQDAFLLYKKIGLRDHIVPVLLGAGCAGFARAMALASQMTAKKILLISYSLSSLYTQTDIYKNNSRHPYGKSLWMSAALFSDGVSAVVLEKQESITGCALYSRDSLSFGQEEGFDDPLIHYTGSGAWNPPGTGNCEDLSCFAMSGPKIKEYYIKGMTLNHQQMLSLQPGYLNDVKKIYTHQASPMLTNAFLDTLIREHGIRREKVGVNVVKYGNLVSTSTIKLLDDDIASGEFSPGDKVCISVVGAGPERGAFIIPVMAA